MASTVKPPTEGFQSPQPFSYAQAAKGRAAASPAVQSSQATSGVNTPAKESNSSVNTPSASVNGTGGSDAGDRSVAGSFEIINKADALGVGMESESKSTIANATSSPTSPSFGTASTSTLPKEEDLTLSGTALSESAWDKPPGHTGERYSDAPEGRRGKKGKKQKNAEKEVEKEKEEVKPEILVPAPPPAVNFWEARKEMQAAKAKPSPPTPQSQAFPDAPSANGAKSVDSKKRGKGLDEEKPAGGTQNSKESAGTNKGQKKSTDITKGKDDPTKRPSRGIRLSEKDEKPSSNQLPPPVEDAISWPTPETALEEEKRKAHEKERSEKEERDETTSNKPRPKEKWVPVPYIPTVQFNTPLPMRGTRGRGGRGGGGRDAGGRNSHAANNTTSGEKAGNPTKATADSGDNTEKRGRGDSGVRANSLPPLGTKRLSDGEPLSGREGRKALNTTVVDKPKADNTSSSKNEPISPTNARRTSTATQTDLPQESFQTRDNSKTFKQDQLQGGAFEGQLNPRSGAGDRRSEPNIRGAEQLKEGGSSKENSHPPRAGVEGRADRGRGGYRGRGGHNNFPNGQQHGQHPFTNGHAPQVATGYPQRQSTGPYSPPLQPPFNSNHPYSQNPSRGRGNSRSQSIPNNAMYGRFPTNSSQLTPIQTGIYDYGPMQPMSAVPYNSYMDGYSVLAMVTMQLEYYFSIDNLCKDVFLRKHMDSQGFVFLSFIAGFKRIQALSQDWELLRYACSESDIIDIVKGEDGVDRVRRREGWEKWVLTAEERDESVRNNAGPTTHYRNPPTQRGNGMGMALPGQNQVTSPTVPPTATESIFRYGNGSGPGPILNGNGNTYHPETPLSAAVPDFSPSLPSLNGSLDSLESETTFTDKEVENLNLVFRSRAGDHKQKPYHTPSSRTFSNGSIDGRSISEELHDERQGRALVNGSRASETSPENVRRSRSPFALSPTSSSHPKTPYNGPPVMWVKGEKQPMPIENDNTTESYVAFRERALRHREQSSAGDVHEDMKQLYEFWSHFLCRNFNPKMYNEFRKYALEDAEQNARTGTNELIKYYDVILQSRKKTIHDTLAKHYVELVKNEDRAAQRPGFTKLRAAWRNGSLDLKSRKKIDNLLDAKLKEELER